MANGKKSLNLAEDGIMAYISTEQVKSIRDINGNVVGKYVLVSMR